jgi:hypothetical protein
MKRNYTIFIGLLAFLLILTLTWWWLTEFKDIFSINKESSARPRPSTVPQDQSDSNQPASPQLEEKPIQSQEVRQREAIEAVIRAVNRPILCYGKVIDQLGEPVPEAYVGYTLRDTFGSSGTNGHVYADAQGYFKISGVKGDGIDVSVQKKGYYRIKASTIGFNQGEGLNAMPRSKNNPAVFVLQKMGEMESLIFLSSRQIEVSLTQGVTQVDLTTGKTGQGDLHIKATLRPDVKNRYDWNFTLSIPSGGLLERMNSFDFEAPKEGYKSSIDVGMLASDPAWKSGDSKSYFIKLPSKQFARVEVRFYPSDYRNMIVLESYLNPTPGSRNLEYDPAKRINP